MNTKTYLAIIAVVALGLAGGAFALNSGNDQQAAVSQVPTTPTDTNVARAPAPITSKYKDGSYTAVGEYRAPSGRETVNVTLTLKNDVIVDSTVVGTGENSITKKKQAEFIGGYKEFVTGKNIDEVKLTVVSGSSLTGGGFNAALDKIKVEAKS